MYNSDYTCVRPSLHAFHFNHFPLSLMLFLSSSSFFKTFIYFWLHWVFIAACGLSLVVASRGYSSLQCTGFSLQWLLLLRSMGSRRAGFSSCGTRAQQLWLMGSRAQAQQLWHTGLVAPQHVGSSRTRARTRVPCIGKRILNHCTTREVPLHLIFMFMVSYQISIQITFPLSMFSLGHLVLYSLFLR